ncbi:cytochrome P450 [Streptomyces sp. NPDC127168]|uniref:cytochrome P450 n=1 Tax=unclassified Streptomyces TaxID=2593676 RepID=UPI00363F98CB
MLDSTRALLAQGYAWLPGRHRRSRGKPVHCRLMGKNAVALRGPEAVRFFYDEKPHRAPGRSPGPVLDTLFGRGAVHTLDGRQHRVRKALAAHLETEWARARQRWAGRDQVVLFDEAGLLLTRGVCTWSGVPLDVADAEEMANDLVAMVDGFASPGPRHLRARRTRSRQEKRLTRLVEQVRGATGAAPAGSVLAAVAAHRDADGQPLDAHTAAVEVLNVLRPTVAVSWFLTFAAHALHRWPEHRERLADRDAAYARAFAHEVRRFYPFAPFVGGLAAADLLWDGHDIPAGSMVLLDLYGQNHDPDLWPKPYIFDPGRFVGREPGRETLVPLLAQLRYHVMDQDLGIPLRRMPTAPRSGFVMTPLPQP